MGEKAHVRTQPSEEVEPQMFKASRLMLPQLGQPVVVVSLCLAHVRETRAALTGNFPPFLPHPLLL